MTKNFKKSETGIETCESKEDFEYPQEYNLDSPFVISLDNSKENKIKDFGVQSTFKRS